MSDITITAPTVYGREISWDVYGSNMIFATRRDAEDFPCISVDLCDEVNAFTVWKMSEASDDLIAACHEDIAEVEPQHSGRNSRLFFVLVEQVSA